MFLVTSLRIGEVQRIVLETEVVLEESTINFHSESILSPFLTHQSQCLCKRANCTQQGPERELLHRIVELWRSELNIDQSMPLRGIKRGRADQLHQWRTKGQQSFDARDYNLNDTVQGRNQLRGRCYRRGQVHQTVVVRTSIQEHFQQVRPVDQRDQLLCQDLNRSL